MHHPCLQPSVFDSNLTLHATSLCTPDVFRIQFMALQQLAVTSGTNMTDLWSKGTVAYFDSWRAPVPVLSAVTKVASECTWACVVRSCAVAKGSSGRW